MLNFHRDGSDLCIERDVQMTFCLLLSSLLLSSEVENGKVKEGPKDGVEGFYFYPLLLGKRVKNHFHAPGVTKICGVERNRVALLFQPTSIFAIPNNCEVIFIPNSYFRIFHLYKTSTPKISCFGSCFITRLLSI